MKKQQNKHILIVDDNVEILEVIRRILTREKYQVTKATCGREALDKAADIKPDLMVLDLMLPDIDGIEVCRTLRKGNDNPGLMIVMLTARGTTEHKIEGYQAGADDYIEKPFHRDEFVARIKASLRLKELRDQLEERNKQLITSQKALVEREKMATIGLLASGLAHEFNNIMASISGYAQMAKKNQDYFPTLIETALTQAQRAKDIIDSLRTFIKPQMIHFMPVPLKEILASVNTLVRKKMEKKSVLFEWNVPDDFPPLRGVPGQLQQVFMNLVLNAVDATEQGGRVAITAVAEENSATITVTDTGCGIPEQHRQRIFDPFFTTKGVLGGGDSMGTGLGLTVVYNLIHIHQGTVAVQNQAHGGTAFIIELPIFREDKTTPQYNKTHVLAITQDKALEAELKQVLPPDQLTFVPDLDAAALSRDFSAYTTTLLDVDHLDGDAMLEGLSWLRCQRQSMLVVVIATELKQEEAMKLADRHLLKPCSPEVIHGLLLNEKQNVLL